MTMRLSQQLHEKVADDAARHGVPIVAEVINKLEASDVVAALAAQSKRIEELERLIGLLVKKFEL